MTGRSVEVRVFDAATLDGAQVEACESYVAGRPDASAYHAPRWLDVIRRAFGHQTRYLVAQRAHEIVGVLPLVFFRSRIFGRFAVSMPFLNYGGILADDADAARALLVAGMEETRRGGGTHLELRHTEQLFPELSARRHKVAMRLALATAADRQWQALDKKIRNQVRKAEKSGLATAQGGLELLPQFYEVFAHNMRDLGTPVYGVDFFRQVLTTFADRSRLFVVTAGDRPAAAALVHWHRDTIEVPWASSLRQFNPACANVFLYWQMVSFAVERGFKTFDFGRSTPDGGTFHFKKQWGAESHELVWEYWRPEGYPLPDLNPANPKFGLAIRAWQRLPVNVATTLGPLIVRNIP